MVVGRHEVDAPADAVVDHHLVAPPARAPARADHLTRRGGIHRRAAGDAPVEAVVEHPLVEDGMPPHAEARRRRARWPGRTGSWRGSTGRTDTGGCLGHVDLPAASWPRRPWPARRGSWPGRSRQLRLERGPASAPRCGPSRARSTRIACSRADSARAAARSAASFFFCSEVGGEGDLLALEAVELRLRGGALAAAVTALFLATIAWFLAWVAAAAAASAAASAASAWRLSSAISPRTAVR